MSVLLTYLIIEGILFFVINNQKIAEQEFLQRWRSGQMSYLEIQALTRHRKYFLKKLDKTIQVGKHPGLCKKED